MILGYLAIAFKVWMVIDALRRGVGPLWFIAVLVIPFGDWLYFLAVKLRDYNVRPAPEHPQEPKPDLERLREEAATSPSFDNRSRLAWALLDADQPAEAERYFELALTSHRRDREARHGLGLSQLARKDYESAIETLSQLTERSLAYDDYRAALALAEALFLGGYRADALELLEALVRDSNRVEHQVALAQYQLRANQREQAQQTLSQALRTFEALPDFLRRRSGAAATEARRLLRTLEQS